MWTNIAGSDPMSNIYVKDEKDTGIYEVELRETDRENEGVFRH